MFLFVGSFYGGRSPTLSCMRLEFEGFEPSGSCSKFQRNFGKLESSAFKLIPADAFHHFILHLSLGFEHVQKINDYLVPK